MRSSIARNLEHVLALSKLKAAPSSKPALTPEVNPTKNKATADIKVTSVTKTPASVLTKNPAPKAEPVEPKPAKSVPANKPHKNVFDHVLHRKALLMQFLPEKEAHAMAYRYREMSDDHFNLELHRLKKYAATVITIREQNGGR